LHGKHIIHRDVKTANVLFDSNWHVRLCDYGLSVGDQSEARLQFVGGTEQFMAPELLLADYGSEGYGAAVDMFSFGLVAAALIGLVSPGEDGFLVRSPRTFFEVILSI
jgi:serine/threonine protein kinase